jgi:PD-(D/E)XK nuclease superfamily
MTDLVLAGAERSAPAVPSTAASLAARIPVPARLPERYDGEPLRHLSPSSYSLWVSCPEAWRRRYIQGEKPPPTGSMFLGSRVDDALSAYHRRILEHGDHLAVGQVLDLYREQWHAELEAERDKQGIDWDEDLPERAAFELGRQAIELAMAELIPHLGDPVDVQRRLEFSIAPVEWTVLGYLDLETVKERPDGEPVPTVVDFKVKGSLIGQEQADSDPQARIYLAGRWLEGYPASELCFAQLAKPGKRRKQMAASLVSTTRTAGQMRGVLARVALAASQIAAAHERYGPDQPWGFADPTSWKCSPRFGHAWQRCPGGHGL